MRCLTLGGWDYNIQEEHPSGIRSRWVICSFPIGNVWNPKQVKIIKFIKSKVSWMSWSGFACFWPGACSAFDSSEMSIIPVLFVFWFLCENRRNQWGPGLQRVSWLCIGHVYVLSWFGFPSFDALVVCSLPLYESATAAGLKFAKSALDQTWKVRILRMTPVSAKLVDVPVSCRSNLVECGGGWKIHIQMCCAFGLLVMSHFFVRISVIYIHMRVSINGGTPKWMIYSGKSMKILFK